MMHVLAIHIQNTDMNKRSSLLSLLSLFLLVTVVRGQVADQGVLKVEGEVAQTLTLHPSDLDKMPRIDIRSKDRDEKEHSYSGVALTGILQQAGVTLGAQLRGENMTKYLLVRSGDGYEVLFSLAELDSSFTDRTVLLVDKVDGQPLPAGKGPFRIVVPGEKKHARWIWEVRSIFVRSAKE
jgi:DMSO/TMAO reductase YedYZ molybdopterin-dependent catalytic subunit